MATNQGPSSLDPEANVPPASETTPLLASRDPQPDGQDNREIEPAVDRRQQYWVSIAFSVFLFAAFILLVILLALYRHTHRMAPTALCLTPACVHASDTLLRSLSPNYKSLDPCTNFEECKFVSMSHVCFGFLQWSRGGGSHASTVTRNTLPCVRERERDVIVLETLPASILNCRVGNGHQQHAVCLVAAATHATKLFAGFPEASS